MSLIVRDLTAQDEARWRALWDGYLSFYEQPDLDSKVTDNTWSMLTGGRDDVFGLVAESGDQVVGIVNCVVHANTWTDKPVCYLEDLFVDPLMRGQGAGKALIEGVAERAKAENWHRVYWRTADGNATAQALYDKLAKRTSWVTYEMEI